MAHKKPNEERYVDKNTGPYPDGDPRNVTLTKSDNPIEPPRSGPREHQSREGDAPASANAAERAKGGEADGEGAKSARPEAKGEEPVDPDKRPVGETSGDPAERARADANRPLGG